MVDDRSRNPSHAKAQGLAGTTLKLIARRLRCIVNRHSAPERRNVRQLKRSSQTRPLKAFTHSGERIWQLCAPTAEAVSDCAVCPMALRGAGGTARKSLAVFELLERQVAVSRKGMVFSQADLNSARVRLKGSGPT